MRKIYALLFLTGALLLYGTTVEAAKKPKVVNHAENAYEAGMKAYEKQEFQNAVYAFQNSIDYNSKLYKSHYMLGMALIMNNETQSAVRVLKNAVNDFPNEWQAQALLGEYYAGIRDYENSLSYYRRALEAKKIKGADKETVQKKITEIERKQEAEWRVSEEMKSKVLKAVDTKLETSWRPRAIEKRGKDLHVVFASRDDDYQSGKWKNIIDLKCYTDKKDFGYAYANERVVADFRAKDAELDTLEQDEENRYFETQVNDKQKEYIVGRIFPSAMGYCLAQVRSHTKMKEADLREWVEVLRNFKVDFIEGFDK